MELGLELRRRGVFAARDPPAHDRVDLIEDPDVFPPRLPWLTGETGRLAIDRRLAERREQRLHGCRRRSGFIRYRLLIPAVGEAVRGLHDQRSVQAEHAVDRGVVAIDVEVG